ncbi:uncharacterized protein CDV56_108150 [Aspergillus thermomutatus]|uniref:Bifunctional lycopene cyclase/phytoene synthase n=1 Tax=Aspergillus thermomutatus TaxID=41047 RepID=A0A397HUN6_ASPTH|nr:uncharacterized protein CDV56_108150 [Aspergillus thermomutatus]RHZ66742.1 hypothetical protein CDV56_108150 [Aspergillus thermomutatus]
MGLDYLFVHVKFNLPPALVMTGLYWPFFTRLDFCRITFLISVALIATTPWDSYLIRHNVWTYPSTAVIGKTIFSVPVEEVFFFIIQTYNTSLLYVILTKRFVLPMYLREAGTKFSIRVRNSGMLVLGVMLGLGMACTWVIAYQFMVALPRREILLSIGIPTLYLWYVDRLSLQRGTWVIESGTKLGIQLWDHLDVEEALFFLLTNTMIVLGLVAVDHAVAIAQYEIASGSTSSSEMPSFQKLFSMYMIDRRMEHDERFLESLADAVQRVASRSQSMYMGSAMFQGQLRIDLIFLYSFCRIIDDLVDEAPDRETARRSIQECSRLLHLRFNQVSLSDKEPASTGSLVSSIELLPVSRLSIQPLLGLLQGMRTDLTFDSDKNVHPIATEADLETYAYHVAGTVAASVFELIFSHYGYQSGTDPASSRQIIAAGERMGQALQYVNIARDVDRDAQIGRVYLPTTWLGEFGLTPADVLADPTNPALDHLKRRLLDKADDYYRDTVDAIDRLPNEVRGPIKTTLQSYMGIGRAIREGRYRHRGKKLKVPLWRRLVIAYSAMS